MQWGTAPQYPIQQQGPWYLCGFDIFDGYKISCFAEIHHFRHVKITFGLVFAPCKQQLNAIRELQPADFLIMNKVGSCENNNRALRSSSGNSHSVGAKGHGNNTETAISTAERKETQGIALIEPSVQLLGKNAVIVRGRNFPLFQVQRSLRKLQSK